jgi:hypothetical protein
MRQPKTGAVRLDQGKATSFGAAEAGNATIRLPTSRLRLEREHNSAVMFDRAYRIAASSALQPAAEGKNA